MLIDLFGQSITDLEVFGTVHYAFLSKEIPILEGLQNLDAIAKYDEVVFAGFPLKTSGEAGDAAPMRAVALIY
jgi:kynurenine formamidase